MIETKLAQIVVVISSYEKDRIPSKPKETMETTNFVRQGTTFLKMVEDFILRKVILGTPSLLAP